MVETVAFGRLKPGAAVESPSLHELAHMFHTTQMRVTLVRGGVGPEDAAAFLKVMENGSNYLEFERAATSIGSYFHKYAPGATGAPRYAGKITQLIDFTDEAFGSGEVRITSGFSIEELYAWTLSRLPLVLGKSVKELVLVRMPIAYFARAYAMNMDISAIPELNKIDRKTLNGLGLGGGRVGLRDLIDAGVRHSRKE